MWSAGITTTEASIHTAYCQAILSAKHFIYIENQFFITQTPRSADVYNGIGDALYKRIVTAHRRKEVFRVYVVMPLLPAFEGEIGTGTGVAIQAITHWNYASICRGSRSLLRRISRKVGDPSLYITFYGLRTHGEIQDKLVTELVYVPSKLMIVDDCRVIVGSANVNDRSLLGRRDSEVAVILDDVEFDNSLMNGQPYAAGKCAGSLRRTLFREHLGFLGEKTDDRNDVADPISERFYREVWLKIAACNTELYETVFHCVPSDEVRSFTTLKKYLSAPRLEATDPILAKETLQKVQGHLVLLPLHFLCEEKLTPAVGTKEALVPSSVWT